MPSNKGELIVVDAKLNRFYLGTVVAGATCVGFEYGWLVGLGVGLLAISVLGGMDEIFFSVRKLDLVNRSYLIDVCERLTSIDAKLTLLLEKDATNSDGK